MATFQHLNIFVALLGLFIMESYSMKKTHKPLPNLHMKTTHKPLYGNPVQPKKNKGLIDSRNLLDKYFEDRYTYYYEDDDEEVYANNMQNGNGKAAVNAEVHRSFAANEEVKKLNSEGVETFKEGEETDSAGGGGQEAKYGFVDAGDNGDLYVNKQDQAGLPFVGQADYSKKQQILDDPFRFPGGGVFQSNIVRKPKLIKNCDNEDDVQYYCVQLKDGLYFDPWNPWCGYIDCAKGISTQVTCSKGTWMGLSNVIRFTIKDMCRKRLPRGVKISNTDICPELTDYELCKNAENVEKEGTDQKKS